jgi:hypothetical protein
MQAQSKANFLKIISAQKTFRSWPKNVAALCFIITLISTAAYVIVKDKNICHFLV